MPGRPLKVGVYFSHYECLGHTSRVIAIGEVFKKMFPKGNIFFIQAGRKQQTRLNQLGRVYVLPKPFLGRHNFRHSVHNSELDVDERGKMCKEIITQEAPDLLITEFFPLGREESRFEIIPTLIQASKQGTAIWGVAGYPLLIGIQDHNWRQKILKLYQRILIFSPSQEKQYIAASFRQEDDRRNYLSFFEKNKSKIVFAGYFLPRGEIVTKDKVHVSTRLPVSANARRVTVVRGGGAYYPKIIVEAIRASELLGKEFQWTIIAGPSTSAREWPIFSALAKKKRIRNLVLHRSVGNYEELIAKSDVCVSVASYHSSVMLMKYRKKSIIIPFEGYGKLTVYEQSARARMLVNMIGSRILSIHDLTAHALADIVKDVSFSSAIKKPIPQSWFNGEKSWEDALTKSFA
jgi:predicted glycosyltransferase